VILASGAGTGGSAGPIGLLIVLLIGTATVLLIRNMNKRLRRLPREFSPPEGRRRSRSAPLTGRREVSGEPGDAGEPGSRGSSGDPGGSGPRPANPPA